MYYIILYYTILHYTKRYKRYSFCTLLVPARVGPIKYVHSHKQYFNGWLRSAAWVVAATFGQQRWQRTKRPIRQGQ